MISSPRALAVLVTAFFIQGCATPCEPTIQTVEVKVPISVPCAIKMPPKPHLAIDDVPGTEFNVDVWTKAYQATIEQMEGYIDQITAASKGCQ